MTCKGVRGMKQYNAQELEVKIQSFIARKTQQYPELMRPKQSKWASLRAHFGSTATFPSVRIRKQQIIH